ncbi:hypothetical protein E2C01_070018 [Portunus trituberculatus]|uniref:Uncharacterized protein n=1 Tax=Portunus trituberculatus TaxID=210409 RepID=A0A5B7I0H4_PORTR|nr:hypothetical protein [Portunus trituberculatus]
MATICTGHTGRPTRIAISIPAWLDKIPIKNIRGEKLIRGDKAKCPEGSLTAYFTRPGLDLGHMRKQCRHRNYFTATTTTTTTTTTNTVTGSATINFSTPLSRVGRGGGTGGEGMEQE